MEAGTTLDSSFAGGSGPSQKRRVRVKRKKSSSKPPIGSRAKSTTKALSNLSEEKEAKGSRQSKSRSNSDSNIEPRAKNEGMKFRIYSVPPPPPPPP